MELIILKDIEEFEHEFHFTIRHLGDRVGIDAFEIKDGHRGGYEFSLIGDFDKEIFDLFGKLFERMLMTYEGFHFKLEIFDRSEEMP